MIGTFTAEEATRFMRKLQPDGDCLLWTGCVNSKGYGCVGYRGEIVLAHRLAHAVFVGPIPDSHEVDHLCCRPLCCAPVHLEAVTGAENMRRRYAVMDHCPRGHEFTPATLGRALRKAGL